jgi:quercetin dioxygenase-like cupin family protein
LPLIDTHELPEREPKPGWHGRFFDSQGMSFAHYRLDAGASLPEHSHPQEEVWNVITGELEITIGGDLHRAGPGAAALVPPDTAHSVRALTASTVIVVDGQLRGAVGGGERAALTITFDPPSASGTAFEIRNRGRTDATVRRIDIESRIAPGLPAPTRTQIPVGDLPLAIEIAGGSAHRATHEHAPLGAPEREALQAGSTVFYVRGAVFYEDASGERHHTTFCRILDPVNAGGALTPPARPGYNYGD